MILPLARSKDVVIQNLESEILIYDLITNKAFCLNETSAIVYHACDGQTTFDDLRFKHKFTDEIIFFALKELQNNSLIESDDSNYFAGLSRREVIKKIGLATMVALPVISSVVAPTAAWAASGGLFAPCSSPADCSASASNCAEGIIAGSPKRCCIGTSSNTIGSGQQNNSCSYTIDPNSPSNSCTSSIFTCLTPATRCCSGAGTISCTVSGNIRSCSCTCN